MIDFEHEEWLESQKKHASPLPWKNMNAKKDGDEDDSPKKEKTEEEDDDDDDEEDENETDQSSGE